MTFERRVLLITGASGGLGRVVAREAAADGAAGLVLAGASAERLAAVQESLVWPEGLALPADRSRIVVGDLRQPAAARTAVAAAIEAFRRLDVVVHVVGGWIGGRPIVDTAADDLATMLDQHVWTTFHVLQAAVPPMVAAGWGRFVAVTSPVGSTPTGRSAPYSVAKAAQESLVATQAKELAGSGVTANLVVVKAIDVEHERDRAPTPKNAAWATPEEITAAIRWLCNDGSGTINGARIPLGGEARRRAE